MSLCRIVWASISALVNSLTILDQVYMHGEISFRHAWSEDLACLWQLQLQANNPLLLPTIVLKYLIVQGASR